MTILGIDPGTTRGGYGVIRTEGHHPTLVTAGILAVPRSTDTTELLAAVHEGVRDLCKEYRPDVLAIEKLFFAKNRKTALAVAEARGVMLVAAKEMGVPVQEYSPNEVKLSVAGYGGADKKAVLKMVKLILHTPDLKVIDDASDALAIALTAGQRYRP